VKTGDTFDLRAALEEDKLLGLRLDLAWRLRLGGPSSWGISVSKRRETASGREGKPTHLLTLLANEGETPGDLLRQLATVFDQGPVEVGASYPVKETP